METGGVVVFTAQGEVEEQQVRSFLAANGISTSVRGEALRKTHGLTLDGLGMVEVLVAPDDAERARELLAAVDRGELSLAPDESPEDD
jgi:predicted deacylase